MTKIKVDNVTYKSYIKDGYLKIDIFKDNVKITDKDEQLKLIKTLSNQQLLELVNEYYKTEAYYDIPIKTN